MNRLSVRKVTACICLLNIFFLFDSHTVFLPVLYLKVLCHPSFTPFLKSYCVFSVLTKLNILEHLLFIKRGQMSL